MGDLVKNIYNQKFFERFTNDLKLVIKDFDTQKFVAQIMNDKWKWNC